MNTNIVKTVDGKDYNRDGEEVIDCRTGCQTKRTMTGTDFCNRCWEDDHAPNNTTKLQRIFRQYIKSQGFPEHSTIMGITGDSDYGRSVTLSEEQQTWFRIHTNTVQHAEALDFYLNDYYGKPPGA